MTTVELFEDIGLDMTMKRTMEFATKSKQDTWFSSKVSKTITDVAFNKLQNILKLPMDYGEALKYTYVRFKDLDASGRMYYYFVASIELVDDSTVAMHLAVDPIQTFMTEWSVGPCMVNRKHCNRWSSGSLPIRENSNSEGIQASYFDITTDTIIHTVPTTQGDLRVGAVVFTFTKDSGFYTCFTPVIFDKNNEFGISYVNALSDTWNLPTFENCYDNTIFTFMGIDPESVVSMCFLPFLPIEGEVTYSSSTKTYTWTFPDDTEYETNIRSEYSKWAVIKFKECEVRQFSISVTRPYKPSNGNAYSYIYEPALFKEPYIIRKLSSIDGIFNQEIPDIIVNEDSDTIYMLGQVSPSQQVVMCSVGVDFTTPGVLTAAKEKGLMTTVMPASFDVITNAWLTYSLTQRDSDRAIINNNNMQNAISNLLFMGYGGALVGSRGGGIIKDNAIYDNAQGIPKSQQSVLGYRKGINPAIPGAVGLAAGASIVTSLVDAHFAWENQKQQERKIQNKASQISISGNSAYRNALDNYDNPVFVELKCDDVNFEKAAANFRYYGYEINEWQKPDIKSRKYFDYILTNGALVEGAIPQDIKEQIAKVLDNGITFFHADYSTSTQYNNYENIERALI